MKHPAHVAALALLLLTLPGALAAKVTLAHARPLPLNPPARPFYPTMPLSCDGPWLLGIRGH